MYIIEIISTICYTTKKHIQRCDILKKLFQGFPFSTISTLLWCILNESFEPFVIIMGLLLGYFSLYLGRVLLGFPLDTIMYSVNILKLFKYIWVLIFNIYKSSFQCILLIIKGQSDVKVISTKINVQSDWQKVLLSNSVTLTPGTITIDYLDDTILILTNSEGTNSITTDFERYL